MQRQPVMRIVEADVGGIANPVADLSRKHPCPKCFAFRNGSGSKRYRLEPGDARISGGEIAPARMQWTHDEIDRDTARIVEGKEGLDLASRGRFRAAARDVVAVLDKCVGSPLQSFRIADLETDCLSRSRILDEHQRVIAKIRSECGLSVVLLDELEPKDALGEMSRRSKVAGAEPDVSKLFYCNHWCLFWKTAPDPR